MNDLGNGPVLCVLTLVVIRVLPMGSYELFGLIGLFASLIVLMFLVWFAFIAYHYRKLTKDEEMAGKRTPWWNRLLGAIFLTTLEAGL